VITAPPTLPVTAFVEASRKVPTSFSRASSSSRAVASTLMRYVLTGSFTEAST
jgi:hypothetical protein